MKTVYKALYATRNSGQYQHGADGGLTACKRHVRQSAGCRLRWRHEGEDIAAYKSAEDMANEDKAFARIRPTATL